LATRWLKQFGAVARLTHLRFGAFLVAPQALLPQRRGDGLAQQLPELPLNVLPDVVDRAGLQGRDGDAAVLGARHVDDRGRLRQGTDFRQQIEAGLAGHVMVQGDGIDTALRQPCQPRGAVGTDLDRVAQGLQGAPDQATEAWIVVDVEDACRRGGPVPADTPGAHGFWGTCMTEKNNPS
jgi:hypothetical protein